MDFGQLWNSLIVHPLTLLLEQLALFTGSGGLAIILFTILVRLVMLPLAIQQTRSQKAMMALQPELRELQRRYAKDRERLAQEQMRLYRERGVNPAAGCLPLLLQMPIFIGLYSALYNLATSPTATSAFKSSFLWLCSLAEKDYIYTSCDPLTPLTIAGFPVPGVLVILTGVTQFILQRMMATPTMDPQQKAMNQAMMFMPIMFIYFTLLVPSGLVLYWVTTNIFSIVQQYFTTGWGSLLPSRTASENGAVSIAAGREAAPDSSPAAEPNSTDRGATPARAGSRSAKRRRSGKR